VFFQITLYSQEEKMRHFILTILFLVSGSFAHAETLTIHPGASVPIHDNLTVVCQPTASSAPECRVINREAGLFQLGCHKDHPFFILNSRDESVSNCLKTAALAAAELKQLRLQEICK
jgi:hypothetical protein